ncbi:MAG: peptidoglycan DD-metalloendopeptidase family protein [Bacteriovoracaceae bacterium]|jgi:murein DD-endopeptidase MepM/ murein hydrolase activator NlpD|nr:peptidoglycan DD-metalloendopeptidase family protein [Bacteriovoracaceae bacterium]
MLLRLFVLLISLSSFGAKKSLERLKDDLILSSNLVNKYAAQIRSLDKKISSNNELYIKKVNFLKKMNSDLVLLKATLNESSQNVSSEYTRLNKIFRHYLLKKIDQNERDNLVNDKIYLKTLQLQLARLESTQKDSNSLLEQVNDLSNKVTSLHAQERMLYDLIINLEAKKRNKSEQYVTTLEKKNILRDKVDKLEASKKYKKKRKKIIKKRARSSKFAKNMKLVLPLESFKSFSGSKKGVSFVFDEITPVSAVAEGSVVYSGDLSTYGKVVIIDHGHNVRSVVLGNMKINIKKGTMVKKGDVIAYTIANPGVENKLYFELRNKDIAQNTFNVLKRKKLL